MRRFRICFLLLLPLLLLAILPLQSIFLSLTSPHSTHPPACSPETELLVLVDSLPPNSNLRRTIRTTWGNTTTLAHRIRLVFVLSSWERGSVDGEEGDDIVFANTRFFPMLAGLEWSVSACPQVLQNHIALHFSKSNPSPIDILQGSLGTWKCSVK